MSALGPLADGSRVVIIGGGPSGAGCALALQHMASQSGRHLQITLVEGKDYAGERHHNLCVGVLSAPLPELFPACLGLPFPHHLSRGVVNGYILHTAGESIVLEDEQRASLALRRVQFDDYMLEAVRSRGITVQQARAVDVDFHDDCVVVYTEAAPVTADVVVGAFGMDAGASALFAASTPYRPPKALSSILTRYAPPDDEMATFDGYVHAFLPRSPEIEFGAITPKGDYVTVNIAGVKVDAQAMRSFIKLPEVAKVLPSLTMREGCDPADLLVFKGRFPRSLAEHYYGDRYVMVGDAAGLVRAFKGKGVTSGVQTGIRAAQTMFEAGISHAAFAGPYEAANRDITGDMPWGRGVRLLVTVSARFGLVDPVVRAARRDAHVRHALFGAVSAHDPYSHILRDMLHHRAVVAIARALVGLD